MIKKAYALFDTSVIHSFVSAQFVQLHGLKFKLLDGPFCMVTPLRDVVTSTSKCEDCKISKVDVT